jgi:hypothetical protein
MSINDEVTTRITAADAIATAAISRANDAADLFSDIASITPSIFTISAPPTFQPFAPTLVDHPVAPDGTRTAQALAALDETDGQTQDFTAHMADLDTYFAAFDSSFAAIKADMAALRGQSQTIAFPEASDFSFVEAGLDSDPTVQSVNSKLRAIIESEIARGGQGYADETETAMFEQDIERRELARQEEIDESLANSAGRGFSMPQGFHLETVRQINEKYRLGEEKKSEDVMILQSKLAQENKWIAIDAGISYNQILLAFYDAKAQRGLDSAVAVIGLALLAIRLRAALVRQELMVAKTLNTADMEKARAIVERYTLRLTQFKKGVQSLTERAKGYTQKYELQSRVYGAEVDVAVQNSRLDQADNRIQLELDKNTQEGFMAAAKLSLKSFEMATRTKLGVATDKAKLQAAIAAGTISSLGAVIQRTDAGETSTAE